MPASRRSNDVSLEVRAGEIVGVAGVSGNGQRQLIEVLAGQRDASGGEVRIAGELYHATREEMRDLKLSCLPEEPLKNACVARMSVAENMAFRDFDRAPFAAGGWWLQARQDPPAGRTQDRASTRSRRSRPNRRSAICPAATCSARCWRGNWAARSRC